MTEEEWWATKNPTPLIAYLHERTSSRKLRHFVVACATKALPPTPDEDMVRGLALAEAFADGLGTRHQMAKGRKALQDRHPERVSRWNLLYTNHIRSVPAWYTLIEGIEKVAERAASLCAWAVTYNRFAQQSFEERVSGQERMHQSDFLHEEQRHQIGFLRDIFGNPFRPVAFDPAWRTSTAIAIARGIYDDRAFDRMPILADALQDAGCEDADILAHCRGDGPHVRGCWVVDLVLGKE